jgi:hypothetical protein
MVVPIREKVMRRSTNQKTHRSVPISGGLAAIALGLLLVIWPKVQSSAETAQRVDPLG